MAHDTANSSGAVALITGAARRLGAETARALHAAGLNVVVHYQRSAAEADALAQTLNRQRPDSALALPADLHRVSNCQKLIAETVARWGRLDALVNNASGFYPTPLAELTEAQWDDLSGSNLKAPLFLAQAAAPHLAKTGGCIINMVDANLARPLRDHPAYLAAKAGLAMLTRALAKDLAPAVRVNGIAPGAILWPAAEPGAEDKQAILAGIPLGRLGTPADIAGAIRFLVCDAPYITGQILAVDGGRSL